MKTLRGSWSRSIQLVPDEENAQDGTTSSLRPVVTWEFKRNGEPRFCRICGVYKPDRTHHCRSCKRCILKMDHHCPWINNCVGFYNQKFFILFLYCAVLGCLFVMGTGMTALKQALVHINQDEGQEVVRSAIVIICYCIVFIFGIALLFFAGFHTILVLKGRTTIELHEIRDPARSRVVRKYDLGWKKNWQKVFGTCWFYWFLPVRWSIGGDGLTFESVTNEQVGQPIYYFSCNCMHTFLRKYTLYPFFVKSRCPIALTRCATEVTEEPYSPESFGFSQVGIIKGAHGVRGELKVISTSDFAEIRLVKKGKRYLVRPPRKYPRPVFLVNGRKASQENMFIIRLKHVDSREQALELRGTQLFVRSGEALELQQEEYLAKSLIGLKAWDIQTTQLLGKVVNVYTREEVLSYSIQGAQDLLELQLEDRRFVYIPFVKALIPEIDLENGHIWVDPPQGLLGLSFERIKKPPRIRGYLLPAKITSTAE
eukprot:jgi/Galph1/4074/GphlegSOOS_G2746.1